MKTWTRADRFHFCGGCNSPIQKGEPILVMELEPQRAIGAPIAGAAEAKPKPRIRCCGCAWTKFDTTPPKDLPALQQRPPIAPRGQLSFASVGTMARDFKQAQAGREPGEEG